LRKFSISQIKEARQKFFLYCKYYESKLLLISHLLLGEKILRPAEGGTPKEFEKSGQTAWTALRAAHASVGSQPISSILVRLLYQVRTYFQNR